GLAGWVWLAVIIVPIYYIVLTSLRPQEDYYSENPLSLPANPTLDAYRLVLESNFLRYLTNSVLVTVGTIVVLLAVALMASYYLVRSRTRLSQHTLQLFLLGLAIPLQSTI